MKLSTQAPILLLIIFIFMPFLSPTIFCASSPNDLEKGLQSNTLPKAQTQELAIFQSWLLRVGAMATGVVVASMVASVTARVAGELWIGEKTTVVSVQNAAIRGVMHSVQGGAFGGLLGGVSGAAHGAVTREKTGMLRKTRITRSMLGGAVELGISGAVVAGVMGAVEEPTKARQEKDFAMQISIKALRAINFDMRKRKRKELNK